MVGGLGGGFVANHIGRKPTLFINNFILIAGGLLMAFAHSVVVLSIGRLAVGVGSGANEFFDEL